MTQFQYRSLVLVSAIVGVVGGALVLLVPSRRSDAVIVSRRNKILPALLQLDASLFRQLAPLRRLAFQELCELR